ncbi:DUF5518 domain-containing protein [Halomarina halobia]|uniref:DUF5518 domain-containing protein n=1 Tax=Halomarina halobia TaxID=3033386 RepID=A0ABD6AC10_9EURY|nr:DUF5518 domain-containing protein [Halomarina sp. PSR21]
MTRGGTLLNAAIGAVVTVVLSFVPLSPILGGAVAGYLQRGGRREGASVGALSGVFASLPLVIALLLLSSFLAVVPALDAVTPAVGAIGVALAVGAFLAVAAVAALLGALGGFLGVYVREETRVGA